jgi:molybdate transport system permease protein
MKKLTAIILPLCKNTLISSFILIWSRALSEFGATLMLVMLVGVTRMKTETLPGNIYLNVSTNQIDGALASAFLLLILAAFSLFISHLVTRTDWRKQRCE